MDCASWKKIENGFPSWKNSPYSKTHTILNWKIYCTAGIFCEKSYFYKKSISPWEYNSQKYFQQAPLHALSYLNLLKWRSCFQVSSVYKTACPVMKEYTATNTFYC